MVVRLPVVSGGERMVCTIWCTRVKVKANVPKRRLTFVCWGRCFTAILMVLLLMLVLVEFGTSVVVVLVVLAPVVEGLLIARLLLLWSLLSLIPPLLFDVDDDCCTLRMSAWIPFAEYHIKWNMRLNTMGIHV